MVEWQVNRLSANSLGPRHRGKLRILSIRPGIFWLHKKGEFVERLIDCQVLKKSASCSWLIIVYLYYILFVCILCVVDDLSWNRMSFQFLFILVFPHDKF